MELALFPALPPGKSAAKFNIQFSLRKFYFCGIPDILPHQTKEANDL
jgi:hypothetical protein